MNTDTSHESDTDQHDSTARGSSVELVATISVLAFVAITAASLLIATPQSFQAAASAQPTVETATVNEPAERPFHERYRVQPGAESVDAPTF